MSKLESGASAGSDGHHSPSIADQVGETLLGEVGFGPKAFQKESDQYLRNPTYLSDHPELYLMPGSLISTPLQYGWKAVDDTFNLGVNTAKDEFHAGVDFGKAGIVDPLKGAWDGAKGLGDLLTLNPKGFVKNEFDGAKELTIDPIWDALKGVGNAIKPVGDVLSHPLHAVVDSAETFGRVTGDVLDLPKDGVEGIFDAGVKAPIDLVTGHPGKALSDLGNGVKHETVDLVKDGYKGISNSINGAAHAVFDLL